MVLPAPEKMPQAVVEGVAEEQVCEGLVPSAFSGLYTVVDIQGSNHTFYLSSNKNNKFIKTKQIFKTSLCSLCQ